MSRSGPPCGKEQMGRGQQFASEQGWNDGGTDYHKSDRKFGHMRGNEAADREEREVYGKSLTAAYRHIIGPHPTLKAGDKAGARAYLSRINKAIAQGGWTRAEWRRLHEMWTKWNTRAEGDDHRFNYAGNRNGAIIPPAVTANIRQRRIVDEILKKIKGGD